ncbi:ABC transporter permease [Crenobacter intestini]|uniref:Transport permease protein n=1 Tax=Crenobacter intestini TaxID=2563443 RepID=A0A4T0V0L7_9NEIS|nr:ABC transporter permease [Crenobacter intestini]TIC84676.1 metal-dependent hydrolase [Crenobacter intestini]
MQGFLTLLRKEVLRFWKVAFQTVAAPVLTALMYQLIFSHVMARHANVYPGVSYTAFLIPGLAMMSMTQNAFANASSSLIQSKITGNIVFLLLSPLGPLQLFAAYLAAAVIRGLVVGAGVIAVTIGFGLPLPVSLPWIFAFALLGCGVLGTLGLIAGIWAEKFDQLAAFQNFIILPLTFLSGVFYSIDSLPPVWRALSHLNPVFYMIDGFRYGFFGHADVSPWLALSVVATSFIILSALALWLIKVGYKLRH